MKQVLHRTDGKVLGSQIKRTQIILNPLIYIVEITRTKMLWSHIQDVAIIGKQTNFKKRLLHEMISIKIKDPINKPLTLKIYIRHNITY